MSEAQVIPCGRLSLLAESLRQVRENSNVVVLACVSNFITSSDGTISSVTNRVGPILREFQSTIEAAAKANTEKLYLISPPMYRSQPTWYREGLPEVLTLFSQTFSSDRPENAHLLPSFATPEFDSGGVHLTPYSGLEYILHLFDSSLDLLDSLEAPLEEVAVKASESTRVLEDRVMALEQDHRRLNRVVESKSATDAELEDFRKNEKFEDSFLITGLARIPSELVGKAWQERAIADVQAVLKLLMGREYPIVFVQNATSRVPNSEVKYNVQLSNVPDSR